MSYTPTEWKSGDVVTSAKLNTLEQGVAASTGNGILVANGTWEEGVCTLDKTWAEIASADVAFIKVSNPEVTYRRLSMVTEIGSINQDYFLFDISDNGYVCDSENGYPQFKRTQPDPN